MSINEPDFWHFGSLGISAMGQVQLLKNLFHGKLPFSQRNMAIVRRVMITEQNQGLTSLSKTGWTMAGGINTGWLMGYVERKGQVYFFATQLLQNRINNRTDFSNFRKDITRTVLKNLKIVE